MTRPQLEHIIRAAVPDAPAELRVSNEADVFPRADPSRSDLIDGTIGDGSPFQREFGYYALGVDETSAILPEGWRDRLILIANENTRFVRGWCLEIHDLAIAKYAAGREKDRDFTKALVRHDMIGREVLEQRLAATNVDPQTRDLISARIRVDFAGAG